KRGRPPQSYVITKPLTFIYPSRQYDQLLELIVNSFISEYSADEFNKFMAVLGKNMAEATLSEWKNDNIKIKTFDDFTIVLNEELKKSGIPNDVVYENGAIHIKVYNCVFDKIAVKYAPSICIIHKVYFTTLIERTLDVQIEHKHFDSLAKGEKCCHHVLRVKRV
ncbi:MAG: hypothetical protein ACTSQY_10710, partial [Candidatus Odinarchaeia archaeon]